jgi:peroxiredoxin
VIPGGKGLLFLAFVSCATGGLPVARLPTAPLVRPGGETVDVRQLAQASTLTVLVFFAADCHCLQEHEGRLKALYEQYRPRGVQIFMIDSEATASPERDQAEALQRDYPFPILSDRAAWLANRLGADYATFSVIVDAEGYVRYRGGIDTDKDHLRDDATPYLKDALDDLLAGRSPRVAEGKTLGCSLQKW